jgi:hypothetical protein
MVLAPLPLELVVVLDLVVVALVRRPPLRLDGFVPVGALLLGEGCFFVTHLLLYTRHFFKPLFLTPMF